jgi:hypothetical protein
MSQDQVTQRHPNDKRPVSIYSFVTRRGGVTCASHATVREAFDAKQSSEDVYVVVADVGMYRVQRP